MKIEAKSRLVASAGIDQFVGIELGRDVRPKELEVRKALIYDLNKAGVKVIRILKGAGLRPTQCFLAEKDDGSCLYVQVTMHGQAFRVYARDDKARTTFQSPECNTIEEIMVRVKAFAKKFKFTLQESK